jgi:hypothetical protein
MFEAKKHRMLINYCEIIPVTFNFQPFTDIFQTIINENFF